MSKEVTSIRSKKVADFDAIDATCKQRLAQYGLNSLAIENVFELCATNFRSVINLNEHFPQSVIPAIHFFGGRDHNPNTNKPYTTKEIVTTAEQILPETDPAYPIVVSTAKITAAIHLCDITTLSDMFPFLKPEKNYHFGKDAQGPISGDKAIKLISSAMHAVSSHAIECVQCYLDQTPEKIKPFEDTLDQHLPTPKPLIKNKSESNLLQLKAPKPEPQTLLQRSQSLHCLTK